VSFVFNLLFSEIRDPIGIKRGWNVHWMSTDLIHLFLYIYSIIHSLLCYLDSQIDHLLEIDNGGEQKATYVSPVGLFFLFCTDQQHKFRGPRLVSIGSVILEKNIKNRQHPRFTPLGFFLVGMLI
jgi:hypothetical protein